MLGDWAPKHAHYPFTSQGSLVALVIASSLCRLYRRWDLSDPLPPDDSSFREFVQLLVDDVMPPTALIDLFTSGKDAIERVAETLNQHQSGMKLAPTYRRHQQHCQMIDEIGEPASWLQRARANTEVPAMGSGAARLEFGNQTWLRHDGERDEFFNMSQQASDAGFVPLLVSLWRHGVNIEWLKIYPEGSFHKVPLPGYPFQRQAHWLAPVIAAVEEADCVSTEICESSPEMQHAMCANLSPTNVRRYLHELFTRELLIPSTELAEDKPFGELGVTSIMLPALVKHIEAWLGEKFNPLAIIEHPTISRLSAYLIAHYASQDTMQSPAAPVPQMAAMRHVPDHHTAEVKQIEAQPATRGGQTDAAGVAVIGIACHFPEAPDKHQFWNNLVAGRNSIVEVPKLRWDIFRHYAATREKHKSISKWGGFIQGIEYFDPDYFGLKVDVAPHFDPLIRQFLESAVQTFADAGYDNSELAGRRVGVFVGSRVSNYRNRISSLLPETVLGVDQNFIASHISHLFDLRGPNIVLDSACSSSLMSIHTACRSLMAGDCEMALAGGVEILLDESQYLMLSECRALSPDGRCFTFDERANGFVPGEGSGAVLLKPLANAIRDGDTIYAVVNGSAVNNDGRTMGVTTPNPDAQRDVVACALRQAGVSAADISYIEAHGTGTMIGDSIELQALNEVFREVTDDRQFCAVGSVKTNIGHLLCAAGVAGFIKLVLSLFHKKLPPTLNCKYPNQRFNFEASPFYPNIHLSEWRPRSGFCQAGISSFGFAGTNVHMVLSEFDPRCYTLPYQHRRPALPLVQFNKRRFWIDRKQGHSMELCMSGDAGRDLSHSGVKPFMELVDETL
jgi:acyl transferase domain-containing protein